MTEQNPRRDGSAQAWPQIVDNILTFVIQLVVIGVVFLTQAVVVGFGGATHGQRIRAAIVFGVAAFLVCAVGTWLKVRRGRHGVLIVQALIVLLSAAAELYLLFGHSGATWSF